MTKKDKSKIDKKKFKAFEEKQDSSGKMIFEKFKKPKTEKK